MSDRGQSLFDAARNGEVDQARRFLDEGADPSAKDESESTPLHLAAKEGHLLVVELLLGYGADPNAKDGASYESTPLHYAAQHGHAGIAQLLIDNWGDLDAKDKSGSTALHIAAKGKNVSVLKLLLSAGDREAEDKRRNTPLYVAEDNDGNTPLHVAEDENIAKLLLGQPVTVSEQVQNTPLFPITINGNTLDQSIPATEALQTRYVLVQSRTRLSPSDRNKLDAAGVMHLDYVSKNTYLCQYEGDLGTIRQMEPVAYVDDYREEFKIMPSLKVAKQDEAYEVDIIFHEGVDPKSQRLQEDVVSKAHCGMEDVEFFSNRARLTLKGCYITDVASIADIRHVEEVGEEVGCNDVARTILQIDFQSFGQPQHNYQGSNQVIAVADSGLDMGANGPNHHAFGNRIAHWLPIHGYNRDDTGHGTHVCGSAVGDGTTANGLQVMGSAPRANLIVQSIWNPFVRRLKRPSHLERLFRPSYDQGARVHSNSWGTRYKGIGIPFRQMDYSNGATDVDEFVYAYPDMVVCFSAGNNGRVQIANGDIGHIGAQAAAKSCITVGASQSTRGAGNRDQLAMFSSHGPVKSPVSMPNRYKPDLVAPGTDILSATSSNVQNPRNTYNNDPSWCYKSGTSMATPLVAGCAAVVREALNSPRCIQPIAHPTAALIKALLINGADILDTTPTFVPSNHSGFGRVNMANSVDIVHGGPGTGFSEHHLSDSTKVWTKDIEVETGYTTLKATLVWSDPAGEAIKNDLRLSVASKTAHGNNTVQQIVWNSVPVGEITLRVRVRDLDLSPQPFAVVWRLSKE